MSENNILHCDLMVVGTGVAGMAATVFAVSRGLRVAQTGVTGETAYTSGVMDVMGVHPVSRKHLWTDPFAAVQAVAADIPGHPYAHVAVERVRAAMDEFIGFFREAGLDYRTAGDRNTDVLTAMGTFKRTYAVPESMWAGVEAARDRKPCLFVGFRGLKGFSPRLLATVQGKRWPGLRHAVVEFPGCEETGELYPQQLAQALEFSGNREELAAAIRPHLGDAAAVGLPAVLGIYRTREVMDDLGERLGVPVFEIPSLPPSVPGLRLKEAYDEQVTRRGVSLFRQKKVLTARFDEASDEFVLGVGFNEVEYTVHARSVILATGRFLGGGLYAGRREISETVFELPVVQPAERDEWHGTDFLRAEGHPVNRAGVETDDSFRPVDAEGRPLFERLHACGSILAHQDWMREKCGCGVSVVSAFTAVEALAAKR
ncbi:glycerol-3-phosphate dehydrogenase subunit B [Desulfobaculum xiamenense]|uniref:Glycerol-3-phosphate dehydrogenase subunit B n=1 Tax=Desulfobaculum xiamenense TaxID=995050 RepID=A0A846QFB3_9BACT|nr:glycerol-3-phosphate dehydrogenase subunit GlpB [Desulfobaculum xiamenense]NJB67476.1 glycerol-3-phosphate dehydrogenase subunit B [Desulfobaculum xiamenense]